MEFSPVISQQSVLEIPMVLMGIVQQKAIMVGDIVSMMTYIVVLKTCALLFGELHALARARGSKKEVENIMAHFDARPAPKTVK